MEKKQHRTRRGRSAVDVIGDVGKVAGATTSVAKLLSLIIGALNHDSWYNKGALNLNVNWERLLGFETNSSADDDGFKLGVVPTVRSRFEFDLTGSTAIDQMAQRLFQRIRRELRTNLVYDYTEVRSFLTDSLAVQAILSQMSRDIKLRNVFERRFPALWEQLVSVPALPKMQQLTSTTTVKRYLQDVTYAESISLLRTLTSELVTVPVFGDAHQYLLWMFGIVFRDEPNKAGQYYLNDLEFVTSSIFERTRVSDLTMTEFIGLARQLNTRYAVVMADIIKTIPSARMWVVPDASDSPTMAYDSSFANAITNAYPEDYFSGDIVRIDSYDKGDKVTPSQLVSMTMLTEVVRDAAALGLNTKFVQPIDQYVIVSNSSTFVPTMSADNYDFTVAITGNGTTTTTVSDAAEGLKGAWLAMLVSPLPVARSSVSVVNALSTTAPATTTANMIVQPANIQQLLNNSWYSNWSSSFPTIYNAVKNGVGEPTTGSVAVMNTSFNSVTNSWLVNTMNVDGSNLRFPSIADILAPLGLTMGAEFNGEMARVASIFIPYAFSNGAIIGVKYAASRVYVTAGSPTSGRYRVALSLPSSGAPTAEWTALSIPSLGFSLANAYIIVGAPMPTLGTVGANDPKPDVVPGANTSPTIVFWTNTGASTWEINSTVVEVAAPLPMTVTMPLVKASMDRRFAFLMVAPFMNVSAEYYATAITTASAPAFSALVKMAQMTIPQYTREQADWYMPINVVDEVTVNVNGSEVQYTKSEALVKEVHNPAWVSKRDLAAIAYPAQLSLYGFYDLETVVKPSSVGSPNKAKPAGK